jgi:hypothetical protein
LLFP